ncbi:ubiquitin-conjugating enzyme E2 R1 isoform X5 [Bos indicus]|uniref:Ubiquitin-conjugating enzyme E2 R1 isoform X5 n=1 Tax=Bos indicus TaxID=9915 RepID=A0A6P5C493_BOSIN|nr:ubiquitin-conjugating enzyme E2 R1 isoform X4 [Bos taurus]XP_019820385.1 PREDICTED: ubiquitin-conjugating enzyme E2 R1 isoform X5 [Bos indicus]XP_027402512.1 ubiquitin-conjugating enzyme E2 R1 isoform X5 [Bos indicus x Bos taurus]XP_061279237.1 ubiquitin-conjugating enzyme E2 R1 isoform X5 [Bos javanicus]
MARPLVPSSQKALLLELKGLQEEPVEGFRVTLVDEGDLYNWEVAIFGPPNTYYEGGYFKARLKFPIDYPYSPPAFRFLTKMWHPNIYEDHPPECHLPPQRTQHLLASQRGRLCDVQEVEREQRQGPRVHGHHPQVLGTKVDAERDGVKVPTTLAEYCVKTKAPVPDEGSDLFYDDYYEDGEAEADSCFGDDEDDSGTEES